ncbi:MAG: zinc ribbon domain-containing protein [Verrucomicrobiia bacterium]
MPTYDYQCTKCGKRFEFFQSMKDEPLKLCPQEKCGEEWGQGEVKRLLGTGAGLIFKGSGFYITDYRSDSYQQAAKKEAGSTSSTKAETTGSGQSGGASTPPSSGGTTNSQKSTNHASSS